MKILLFTSTLITFTALSTSLVAAPPKVKILVEDEDDFFDDEEDPKPATVRGRAAEAFEALEREEAKHGKVHVQTSDKNNQIVNVVVVGGEQKTEPPAAPPAPAAPPPPVAPRTPPAPPAAPPAGTAEEEWDSFSWFGDDEPGQADLMLFGNLIGHTSGGFGGLGAEVYMTDVIGLRLSGAIGTYGISDFDEGGRRRRSRQEVRFDRVDGSAWANPNRAGEVRDAIAHLMEAALTIHLNPRSSFDPYILGGASHFGYDILYEDADVQGGAGYVKVGAGFNWHIGSFFVGVEVSAYPFEFARYQVEGDDEIVFVEAEETFAAERVTGSAQVGWRF
ncbi:MAG: hypothetical protein RMA76_06035 [Deltaproteobacteria bacterium]|jgi:hypothetical protein